MNRTLENAPAGFGSADGITAATPTLPSAFATASTQNAEHDKHLAFADDLLLKIAGSDRTAFQVLRNAVEGAGRLR